MQLVAVSDRGQTSLAINQTVGQPRELPRDSFGAQHIHYKQEIQLKEGRANGAGKVKEMPRSKVAAGVVSLGPVSLRGPVPALL